MDTRRALGLAFDAVAIAMVAVTFAFMILGEGDEALYRVFLGVGLFALAVGVITHHSSDASAAPLGRDQTISKGRT